MLRTLLSHWLADPLVRDLDIDDPRLTELRQDLIKRKEFLNRIYREWYGLLFTDVPTGKGQILELGSGAGFLKNLHPEVIQSEIFFCSNIQVVLDGCSLPFSSGSLKAILMTDVLHHIPQSRQFFKEAERCLRIGGTIVMLEPWLTTWSRLVYRYLHHEPLDPGARSWEFPSTGPLSGANSALPWIIFQRDRQIFSAEFPQFQVEKVKPYMPFRYLVSGGVSMRSLAPLWSYGAWKVLEQMLDPLAGYLGMFALITLRKTNSINS